MIGTTAHPYVDHDDDHHLKDWMLGLLDGSPDRLAFVAVPDPGDDAVLDAIDERLVRVYDLAKAERPDLGVKQVPAAFAGERAASTAYVMVVHEHYWIGGQCLRGCGETRPRPTT